MPNNLYVFPGTFDPITIGHVHLVRRAVKQLGPVVVAVAESPHKKTLFSFKERVELTKTVFKEDKGVTVLGFDNLLVEFVKAQQAKAILRGLRATTDFEYELQLANMNRALAPEIETVFLTASTEEAFISSTLVKDIARLNGEVMSFVPSTVKAALMAHFQEGKDGA